MADGPGVVLQVAGGETLIGAVEEGIVILGQEDGGYFLPLRACGINTCWIVRAGVQKEDGLRWGVAQEGEVGV